ncbi:MAG: PAS domain-containing protein [Parvibaculaceae bacterium]
MREATEHLRIGTETVPFRSEKLKKFADYWLKLAGDASGVPPRAAFDPIDIPSLLPDIVLLERNAPGAYCMRLQGTAFQERGIADRTGELLVADENNAGRKLTTAAMDRVLDTPCGLHLVAVERNDKGRNLLVEIAAFPLAGADGAPAFVVAIIVGLETLGYDDDEMQSGALIEFREMTEIGLLRKTG